MRQDLASLAGDGRLARNDVLLSDRVFTAIALPATKYRWLRVLRAGTMAGSRSASVEIGLAGAAFEPATFGL